MKILDLKAREVLDSRGNPTIEAVIKTIDGYFSAIVPSGASTGIHEALELRDNKKDFFGKGVKKAVDNVNNKIKPLILGLNPIDQENIDYVLINADGTNNKSNFGANAILSVSLACAKAGAKALNIPLYEHINNLYSRKYESKIAMPYIFSNVLNGGKHAANKLDFQEFMIVADGETMYERVKRTVETYQILKKKIQDKYGSNATNVGDEGGFAPAINTTEEALDLLEEAIKKSGYESTSIAMDVAASEFYDNKLKEYIVNNKRYSADELTDYYVDLLKRYPKIISIEDPYDQDDFKAFAELRKRTNVQIVGDDLLVTNPNRIKHAIKYNLANALLLKVNQIGTLTESLEASALSMKAGWHVMVSHRSGESEDSFISDLVVGIGSKQIKCGAPARAERTAKYNQLLRIDDELNSMK